MARDTDKIIADQTKEIADLRKQIARKREQEAAELGEVVDYTADILANEEKILEAVEQRIKAEDNLQKAIKQRAGKMAGEAKLILDNAKNLENQVKTETYHLYL